MKVTIKGQVTIPRQIRKLLGIRPNSEVEFVQCKGRVELVNRSNPSKNSRLEKLRGSLEGKITTEQIMKMTRGD